MLENEESARELDHNGFMTIRDNPITRAGVFQYHGSQLPDAQPDMVYNVYRPLEELTNPETLESFKGLPIIDEHEMLGEKYSRSPEDRGVHGSILESVVVKGRDVVANLRIWSRTLKGLIDSGKKGLSLGYNCRFEKSSGVFEGIAYHYIQRNIRGNHLALVTQGRSGTAVLDNQDVFDHFDLALDTEEDKMADEDKKDADAPHKENPSKDEGGEGEMTLSDAVALLKKIVPQVEALTEAMAGSAGKEKDGETALDADTEKKDGDEEKCEDEKEEKEDKAMDAAAVESIVNSKIAGFTKSGVKSIMGEVTKRDALAKELTPLIGTFDHSAMDADDVAAYGVEKLGLEAPKGQEKSVLAGYLAGIKKSGDSKTYAMDAAHKKPTGKLAQTLNNAA